MVAVDVEDTIAAIASPPGSGLRGIVRISGPETVACLEPIFVADNPVVSLAACKTATAIAGTMQLEPGLSVAGELLLWPTNRSYTRQPTAEFHTIGSAPVLQMALEYLCDSGARLARPGEFTLRAFLSGRIDLTQAEAVLAVIDSTSRQQFDVALRQLAGGLVGPIGDIRDILLGILAELEAGLDFVEEDIEFISQAELATKLEQAQTQLVQIADQISARDRVASAVKVVLFGEPNSGKSSLFNSLSGADQVIVTDTAGTTTDFISCQLTIESLRIELFDTAGFEQTTEIIASMAQDHRATQLDDAHVRLLCIETPRLIAGQLSGWELEQIGNCNRSTIIVLTKLDLCTDTISESAARTKITEILSTDAFSSPIVFTSSTDGTGIERLRQRIFDSAVDGQSADLSTVASTVIRAGESLGDALKSVQYALDAVTGHLGEEIVAAEIRQSLEALGQVVGAVYTDDILDIVFGRFCIGK